MAAFLRNLLLATAQQYFDGADDAQHSLERRLRLYAAAYTMLAVAFLLRGTPQLDGGVAVTVFLLWVAAVTLLLLSFVHQRFPVAAIAASGVANAALEPLFELLI
ncbi:hypothetical protein ACUV84_014280 [Puccinellia chinampoensis]